MSPTTACVALGPALPDREVSIRYKSKVSRARSRSGYTDVECLGQAFCGHLACGHEPSTMQTVDIWTLASISLIVIASLVWLVLLLRWFIAFMKTDGEEQFLQDAGTLIARQWGQGITQHQV